MLGSIFIAIAFIGLLVWRIMMSSPDNIGKAGERRVARKLAWLPKEYIVLNDIMLPTVKGKVDFPQIGF